MTATNAANITVIIAITVNSKDKIERLQAMERCADEQINDN